MVRSTHRPRTAGLLSRGDERMPSSGRLLLTGFEPFGGEALNPSQALLHALEGERIGGLQIATAVLPCVFAQAPGALQMAIERHAPVLVLATGQAGGRSELCFERVAINLIDARIPDNAGEQPVDEPVQADGPAAYFSTLPLKAMVAAARAAGVPAAVSHTAGTFVCNQVFYALQHGLSARSLPAGFVHVPWLPEQAASRMGQPSMSLDAMVCGLRAALASGVEVLQRGDADATMTGGSLH